MMNQDMARDHKLVGNIKDSVRHQYLHIEGRFEVLLV